MTSFLSACGVTDSLQLVVKSQTAHEAELQLLRQPFAVIGRTPRADVVLDHQQVSRRHVYLQVVDGWAFWIDLESRTGTRGESDPQKFGWLQGQRTLCIGPYVFQRHVSENQSDVGSALGKPPRDTPLVAFAYSHASLPQVSLEFLNGPSQSMSWPMHRVMSLIGSASGCKFRLTDPSVSKFHASLLRTSAGLWIVDLLGQNGITVNEKTVRFSRLNDDDVLGIGRYRIRVRCRSEGQGSGNGSGPLALPRLQWVDRGSNGLRTADWAATALASEPGVGATQGAQFGVLVETVPSFSSLEVMPSTTTLPIKESQSELLKSVLVPLVNQFGLMQQQMFDQFQQAMAMMVQMFGTMHHNQMEAIRAELEQLRKLSEEFHSLKGKLADRTRKEPHAMSREPLSTPIGRDRSASAEPGVSTSALLSELSVLAAPAAAANDPSHGQKTSQVDRAVPIPSSNPGTVGHQPFVDSLLSHLRQPPSSSSVATSSSSQKSQAADSHCEPASADASPETDSDRDAIVWIHQRIMKLQQERESRWQKILKLLPGVS
jgi:pSer/pThr/pTyr-binding forkhead associated (FHA) protein